jgi:ADP-ribose pyrophosphatase YjhB (NUDIX family)
MFLLIRRDQGRNDWVLPGGRPRAGESLVACARREAREETGVDVHPTRCAFVLEVIEPDDQRRMVELVFLATPSAGPVPIAGEPGATPEWVPMEQLRMINLRPPIAGFLPALARGARGTAPYLGNVWRPPSVVPNG